MHELQGLRVDEPALYYFVRMHRADDLAIPSHLGFVFVAFFPGFEIDHVPYPIEVHHPVRPPQLTVSEVNGALGEYLFGVRFKKLARR